MRYIYKILPWGIGISNKIFCMCQLNSYLDIGVYYPSCSSFEITSNHFPWSTEDIVILCFSVFHPESCYSFDGKINYIGDSNSRHFIGGLAKYKKNLVTYGHEKAMLERKGGYHIRLRHSLRVETY